MKNPPFFKELITLHKTVRGQGLCKYAMCICGLGKDFIQLVLITGPVFDIKQVSPSLEIGCVSHKFTSFVEF